MSSRTPLGDEIREVWSGLDDHERRELFDSLEQADAEELFFELTGSDQAELLLEMPAVPRRRWVRLLPPDDIADLIQELPAELTDEFLQLLEEPTTSEVRGLLAYAEDDAGGLMSPRFARVRPDITVDEALIYVRRQARQRTETIYSIYVLDSEQRLLGVVSLRDLFTAPGQEKVRAMMTTEVVTATEEMDQEALSNLFARHDLMAVPVVDSQNRVIGVVTVDDIVDVVQEEATEDMQKMGGMEVLDAPYLRISLLQMIKKRAGWLTALFLGEMLTATAMGVFQHEIQKAVVLALFIPLIISSGGNSGSQASTLVIRAMALGEVRLRDVLRVAGRELITGISLGVILGLVGMCRIAAWQGMFGTYGAVFIQVGATVAVSLVGVVLFGSMAGAMLPFALRRLGFDPAAAAASLVATLVDVTGLIIYFTVASIILLHT